MPARLRWRRSARLGQAVVVTARVISSILLTLSLCLWLGAHTAQGASLEPFQVDPELLAVTDVVE